ncbi:MAG TPA: hypothetical protein P5081_00270 [Phycisphaerae bacterium]|nr:hypothetical protein [Phycisphaerae bacterium]HRW51287.1 hypothetical protein [Phycisphaerae bacterium]
MTLQNPDSDLSKAHIAVPEACPRCGYNLEGLPLRHVCPECGFEYEPDMLVFGRTKLSAWNLTPGDLFISFYTLFHIAWTIGLWLQGELLSMLPIVAIGAVVCVVCLLRVGPKWAIVRDNGIAWSAGALRAGRLSWRDVTDIGLSPEKLLTIRARDRRTARAVSELINAGQSRRVRERLLPALRARWARALMEGRQLPMTPPMSEAEATAFRQRHGVRPEMKCPACRGRLREERADELVCHRCSMQYPKGSVALRYFRRGEPPWHPMVMGLTICICLVVARTAIDSGVSFGRVVSVVVTLAVFILAMVSWNYYRYRRPDLLRVDDFGIEWNDRGREMTRTPWIRVESILFSEGVGAVCIRLADEDFRVAPGRFFDSPAQAQTFARYLLYASLATTEARSVTK